MWWNGPIKHFCRHIWRGWLYCELVQTPIGRKFPLDIFKLPNQLGFQTPSSVELWSKLEFGALYPPVPCFITMSWRTTVLCEWLFGLVPLQLHWSIWLHAMLKLLCLRLVSVLLAKDNVTWYIIARWFTRSSRRWQETRIKKLEETPTEN